jgi:NADH-quinone oxidoreductase subunit C
MSLKEILESNFSLDETIKGFVESIEEFRNDISVFVKKEGLLKVARYLHNNEALEFIACRDVTAIDWAKRKNRFTVVHNIYSFKLKEYVRIKVNLDGDYPEIDSVTSIWSSAGWYERETYDMYGIKFIGHPDLRRMYMPEEFEYHPLRKEFPVLGIPGSIPLPDKGV